MAEHPLLVAWATAGSIMALFVGLLYAIPAEVRRLPRDEPVHVRV